MTLTAPISHNTAPTQVVEAAGIGFPYRRSADHRRYRW
jgi:hypothetical protein